MINDEYTDDYLNEKSKKGISMSDGLPLGHSATPLICRVSRTKYRDANWMP